MEKVTRRGLIKSLGTAAASLGIPIAAVAAVKPVAKEETAFRYTCFCGDEVVASVPATVGDSLEVECDGCHGVTKLTWHGDHFGMKTIKRGQFEVDRSFEQ